MQPSSVVPSVCIVCEEERRIKCKLKENESCPVLLNKMWNAFVTYFNLNPSNWEDILTFFNQVYEFPFCEGKCRNDMAKLLVFHDRLRTLSADQDALISLLYKIQKFIANISATIICSQNDDVKQDENFTSPAEFVNYRIRILRQHIKQSYQPQVLVVNENYVQIKVEENSDEDEGSLAGDQEEGSDFDDGSSGGRGSDDNSDSEEEDEGDYDFDSEKVAKSKNKSNKRNKTAAKEVDDDLTCKICHHTFVKLGNLLRHWKDIHRKDPEKIRPKKKTKIKVDDDDLLKSVAVVELGDEKFEYAGWNFKNTETGYWCSCGEKRPAMAHMMRHIADAHLGLQAKTQRTYEETVKLGDGQFVYQGWKFAKTPDDKFICSTCSVVKSNRKNLVQHIKMFHCKQNTSKFTYCEICQRGFPSRETFVRHKRAHKKHRYWPKPDDPNTFVYDGKLEFVKIGESEFKCSTCQVESGYIYRMARHVRDAHIEPELSKCPKCDRQFTARGTLRRHLLQEKCSSSKWSFVRNAETGEKELFYENKWPAAVIGGTSMNDPNTRYQCKTCGQQRRERSSLATHIKTYHIAPCQYPCKYPNCDRQFNSLSYLNLHIARIHSKDSPYTCDYCSESFKVKRNLTLHIQKRHGPGSTSRRRKSGRPRSNRVETEVVELEEESQDVEMNDVIEFISPDPDDDPDAQDPLHDPFEDESTSDINNLIEHIKTEDRDNSHNFPHHDVISIDNSNSYASTSTSASAENTNGNASSVLVFQVDGDENEAKAVEVFCDVQWVTVDPSDIDPLGDKG